jgi:hypothetical protein
LEEPRAERGSFISHIRRIIISDSENSIAVLFASLFTWKRFFESFLKKPLPHRQSRIRFRGRYWV